MSNNIDDILGLYPTGKSDSFPTDDLSDIGIMSDIHPIDLDNIADVSEAEAETIVKKLSAYFFDEEYVREHPYIRTKIKTETDVVRRTIKMLKTNEEAQDAIIRAVSLDPTKAALFSALTSLQNAAGSLQKLLTEHIEELETIFLKIEEHTERTFAVKEKEEDENGNKVARGTRDFLMQMKKEQE